MSLVKGSFCFDKTLPYAKSIIEANNKKHYYASRKIINSFREDTKLAKNLGSLHKNATPDSGVLILSAKGAVHSIMYNFNGVDLDIVCFREQEIVCVIHDPLETNIKYDANLNYGDPRTEEFKLWVNSVAYAILSFIVFKEFVETETKIIGKKARKQKLGKEKVFNETSHDVTLIDSTWFTNIIRNEPFGVKGHFRKQQTKKGIKLIYIKPFVKQGYKRKARK